MKKFLCLILAVILLTFGGAVSVGAYHVVGLQNFEKVSAYSRDVFADVLDTEWFAGNVQEVYEYGLMNGTGSNQFSPNGKVTIAEAITVAARINAVYQYGYGVEFEVVEDRLWYEPYVNYALPRGIISEPFDNYNAPATRAEFAKILAASIDAVDLEEINVVDDGAIPDVPMNSDHAEAVYLLYRAGVLAGSDDMGSFKPESTITRAEAAAIITRIIDPALRQSIELAGEY